MMIRKNWILICGACCCFYAGTALAQNPLFHYPLNEGSGAEAKDVASGSNLSIGSGMGWSISGGGVAGDCALVRVRDTDAWAKGGGVGGKIKGLVSYTITGWYKLSDIDRNRGVLVCLGPAAGKGLQIQFCSKGGNDSRQQALMLAVANAGKAATTGPGVRYSGWNQGYDALYQWVFFSVSVNTISAKGPHVVFYAASQAEASLHKAGAGVVESKELADFVLGDIQQIWLGAGDLDGMLRPTTLGTYLYDIRLYGSPSDETGALSQKEIEVIWHEALKR